MWRRPPRPSKQWRSRTPRSTNLTRRAPAASRLASSSSKSSAPPSLAFGAMPSPSRPPLSRQTARTVSSRTPTMTHTSRPRVKAHAFLHAVRETQERRPVRSRSRSQPGQAREADSRPGPFQPQEHWSKARSATPTTRDQAHSFYRRLRRPSILFRLVRTAALLLSGRVKFGSQFSIPLGESFGCGHANFRGHYHARQRRQIRQRINLHAAANSQDRPAD